MAYKVGVISLGCSKNMVDTENMLGYFLAQGFEVTANPEEADVLVINTCGFIESAKSESIEAVFEMAEYKNAGTCKLLCVTGCLSERYPKELRAEMPEVDIMHGVRDYESFVNEVCDKLGMSHHDCKNAPRLLTTPFYSAYLRIADGCRNRCTYCAIPLIRGSMKSVPEDELLSEAERLAKSGVRELNIIAQDTSAYGIDLYGELRLPHLLHSLAKIDGIHSIRLLYTYPDTVTDELIETIASEPKIANYMDLPIQHINDDILRAMNRRGTKSDIIHIFDKLRNRKERFIIRTSLIVGFPGETDEQFSELMDFISEYHIDRVGAFIYSPEDGTPAYDFDGQIDADLKEERYDKLMAKQRDISLSMNLSRIGEVCELLVCDIEDGYIIGRTYAEAPDVDGCVRVPLRGREDIDEGDFITVRITAADNYDLEGEIYEFAE